MSITLQQATDDIPYVESLLERNELPSRDVRSKPGSFYIGYDGEERIGIGGIESHGDVGLLRSVVIEQSKRQNGYGTGLCEALEAEAKTNDIETLYLLTTTAFELFANRNFVEIDRAAAPPAIQQTDEFSHLCPSTARCMKKSL